MKYSKITVISSNQPLTGQDHRSSENFTTENIVDSPQLLIRTYYGDVPTNEPIFKIKVDKSSAVDPVFAESVKNFSVIERPTDRNLYIADPTASQEFKVELGMCYSIGSDAEPLPGEKHRSGVNFSLANIPKGTNLRLTVMYYQVEGDTLVEAPDVRFSIKRDRKAAKDDTIVESMLSGGCTTEIAGLDDLYVADPKYAIRNFVILIDPVIE